MSGGKDIPSSEKANPKRELRSYCIGITLALALTLASFGAVAFKLVSGGLALTLLSALAVLQIIVHLRFFLHIDLQKSHRDDLQLILFTGLILFLMVGGTVWILLAQHARM